MTYDNWKTTEPDYDRSGYDQCDRCGQIRSRLFVWRHVNGELICGECWQDEEEGER